MKTDEKGQVLIIVTLGFVVLALFAGLAVDLGRAYLLRARLSRVADAAALAAAKALRGQIRFEGDAITAACDAATMNGLSCGDKANITVEFVPRPVEGGPNMLFVQIKGAASVSTTLLRLLSLTSAGDFSKLNVTAFAEAGPERPVDLVLALDRSFSMTETDVSGRTKIEALQIAVNEFLNKNFSDNDRIGMVSFATRGCGINGKDSIDVKCAPDMPLINLDPGYLSQLQDAVNNLVADGGTNTMEALLTARNPIQDAFSLPDRATSRKVVLLVTDGQPTFMRRDNDVDCHTNPRGGFFPRDSDSFPSGCVFGVPGWDSASFWSLPPREQKPGMFRTLLTNPNDFVCSRRIPAFRLNNTAAAELACGPDNLSAQLYLDVIAATRSTQNGAMFEANQIRNLGGKNVLIFAIAIGKDTSMTSPQDSLDGNARCLLARIANDPTTISNCSGPVPTLDGDTHADLVEGWPTPCTPGPPCIDNSQKEGKVFEVNMDGDVTAQLKEIFDKVAALLKIRLSA